MRLKLFKVVGASMAPGYLHGDFVLTFAWKNRQYRSGDVVIARHPAYQTIIKRIVKLGGDGKVLLAGDSPASTSSQLLGWLPQSLIEGKVIYRATANR